MELIPYRAVLTIPNHRVWNKHHNKMENVVILLAARARISFMEETPLLRKCVRNPS